MKKIILFLILGSFVFVLGKYSFSLYSGFKNFPDYATEAVLSKKYESMIVSVDEQIAKGHSALSIAANLESVDYPDNVLFITIEKKAGSDDLIIKDSPLKKSKSTFIKNGFGYGKLGSKDIVIIVRPIDLHGLDDVYIYLQKLLDKP